MKLDPQQVKLVDGCKRGDRSAQHQLYSQYAKAMYNICYRMTGNTADAEDLLQNAFIDVFAKIDTYRSESTIGAWIKRIVINTCINFLKKRKLDTTEWDERIGDVPVESAGLTESDRLSVEKVRNAMQQLPDGYRTVFSLYLLEGYDHGEIAQVLGISEATSKSQYSRAKSKMRMLLAQQEN